MHATQGPLCRFVTMGRVSVWVVSTFASSQLRPLEWLAPVYGLNIARLDGKAITYVKVGIDRRNILTRVAAHVG